MRLGDLVDISELCEEIADGYVAVRRHPSLPLAILNYTNHATFDNRWSDTIMHCRGLIIDPVVDHEPCADCNIVARPFHKFFNLNQQGHPETLESNLPTIDPTVTEKMDGWFGILWKCEHEGQTHYGVASRGSFESPGAVFATGKLPKLIKYGAIDEFPKGYTPIFEIIFKAGKIVVDYPYEGLVLLGLVNNETGEELSYDELQAVWAKIAGYAADNRPWIRLVKAHRLGLDQVKGIETSWDVKNQEGFVLSYPRPGTWPIKVKVKFEDYKRLHKLITGVTPQQIWGALHDPLAPWLGNNVPDHFRKWAVKWRDELYIKFHQEFTRVQDLIADLAIPFVIEDDRKFWAMKNEELNERCSELAPIALTLMRGKIYEAHQAIWRHVRPNGRDDVFYREGSGE